MKTVFKIVFVQDCFSYVKGDVVDIPVNLAYAGDRNHNDLCEAVNFFFKTGLVEGRDYEILNEEEFWMANVPFTADARKANFKLDRIKDIINRYLEAAVDDHNLAAVTALAEIHAIVNAV